MYEQTKTHFKKTPIGEILEDWEVVELNTICKKIKAGGTPLTSKSEYWNGEIPFVKIEDMTSSGKYLKSTKVSITEEGLKNSNAWLVPENSLLLAMYGSLGEVSITRIQVAINQAILGIIPKNREDVEYLYYWFLFFKPYWKKFAKPTTQANLTKEIVENIHVPYPPFFERQKIAEILRTVDEAIEKTDLAIERTERLKRGLMRELLTKGIGHREFKKTELGRIPKEWRVISIRQAGKVITGKTPPTSESRYWNGDIPFITPADIGDNPYVNSTQRFVSREGAEKVGKLLPKDTVLVVCIGSTIGKVALTARESVTNQQINAIICNDTVNPQYHYYVLLFHSKRLKSWSGTAAVPIIKKSLFEKFKIPLPPLDEQKKIAEILSTVDKKLELLRKREEKLERVKRGLMKDLLTGRRRVKV